MIDQAENIITHRNFTESEEEKQRTIYFKLFQTINSNKSQFFRSAL